MRGLQDEDQCRTGVLPCLPPCRGEHDQIFDGGFINPSFLAIFLLLFGLVVVWQRLWLCTCGELVFCCTVQRLSVKDNKGKHFACAMNKVLTF